MQVSVLLAVYFGIQAYHKRDISSGMVPQLQGQLLDGSGVERITGNKQPYVIHFWATWCRVCRLEQGSIAALAMDYPVVTIASQSGTLQQLSDYMTEHDLDFPVLVDNSGIIAAQFGVLAFPTTFIVGTDSVIRFVEVGYTSEIGLRARLKLTN